MQLAVLLTLLSRGAVALSRENFQFVELEDPTIANDLLHIQGTSSRAQTEGVQDTLSLSNGDLAKAEVVELPVASWCVVVITIAYTVTYAALAITRTVHEISSTPKGNLEASLKSACQTLTYGPMVCVVFIAYQIRVGSSSDGRQGEAQIWVQHCMYGVTCAMLSSAFAGFLMIFMFDKPLQLIHGAYVVVTHHALDLGRVACAFVQYAILFCLYGGLAGVVLAISSYPSQQESDSPELSKPSLAVTCTMVIAAIFFVTQFIIAMCRTITDFARHETARLNGIMHGASSIVEFGPMLSILFVAVCMRASQHGGKLHGWGEHSMLVATGAFGFASFLAVVVPMVFGVIVTINPVTNQAKFQVRSRVCGLTLLACRYLAMLGFYGGTGGVCASIFHIAGHDHTPPLSPTLQCMIILLLQFFTFYFILTVIITVSELSEGCLPLESCPCFVAVEAAKGTIQIAPMLAVIFLITRMHALSMTDQKGAPQRWVQDCMLTATWSLLVSALACLAAAPIMDRAAQNSRGEVTNTFKSAGLAMVTLFIRYASLLTLYTCIALVIVGLFAMTPETANGRGSMSSVSDAVNVVKGVLF